MVKLATWQREQGLTRIALGHRIGVSKGAVMKYLSGERPPQKEIALRISIESDGRVGLLDLWGAEYAPLLRPAPAEPIADAPGPEPDGRPVSEGRSAT